MVLAPLPRPWESFAPWVVAHAVEPAVVEAVGGALRSYVEALSDRETSALIDAWNAPSTARQRQSTWHVPGHELRALCGRIEALLAPQVPEEVVDGLRAQAAAPHCELPALPLWWTLHFLERMEQLVESAPQVLSLYHEPLEGALQGFLDPARLEPTWAHLDEPAPSSWVQQPGADTLPPDLGASFLLTMGAPGVPYDFGTGPLLLPPCGEPLLDPSWRPERGLHARWPPDDEYRFAAEGAHDDADEPRYPFDVGWRVVRGEALVRLAETVGAAEADMSWWSQLAWYLARDEDRELWPHYRDRFVAHCDAANARGLSVIWRVCIPSDEDRPG
jgi:hypothetical protein